LLGTKGETHIGERHCERAKLPIPDARPVELAATVTNIASKTQQLLSAQLHEYRVPGETVIDPFGLLLAFVELTASWVNDPTKILGIQFKAWAVWQQSGQAFLGMSSEPIVTQEKGDQRFKDAELDTHPCFDYIKQTYLVAAATILSSVDDKTERKYSLVQ
jgi:polyhydroxyalkanoate synthase